MTNTHNVRIFVLSNAEIHNRQKRRSGITRKGGPPVRVKTDNMKPFFIQAPNGMDYQAAFFVAIGEYAVNVAKSYDAKTAWEKAINRAASFHPVSGLLSDLIAVFANSDTFVESNIFVGGKRSVKVYWPNHARYPVVA